MAGSPVWCEGAGAGLAGLAALAESGSFLAGFFGAAWLKGTPTRDRMMMVEQSIFMAPVYQPRAGLCHNAVIRLSVLFEGGALAQTLLGSQMPPGPAETEPGGHEER